METFSSPVHYASGAHLCVTTPGSYRPLKKQRHGTPHHRAAISVVEDAFPSSVFGFKTPNKALSTPNQKTPLRRPFGNITNSHSKLERLTASPLFTMHSKVDFCYPVMEDEFSGDISIETMHLDCPTPRSPPPTILDCRGNECVFKVFDDVSFMLPSPFPDNPPSYDVINFTPPLPDMIEF